MIVEVDKDQHKSYKCTAYGDTKEGKMKAERVRMYEISQSFAEFPPCIQIRYNPDNFKDENGKLVKMIDEYKETDGIFDIIEKDDMLSI